MDADSTPSIAADCRAAMEAAGAVEEAARAAREILDQTEARVKKEPAARGRLLADASRAVEDLARRAGRDAARAAAAAERASTASRRIGTRADDPAGPPNEAVEEAVQAAARAAETAQEVDELRKQAMAGLAVENELKLRGFFEAHREQIFRKLEECDAIAEHAPTNRDMTFIAESLPIINSIIHVGSDRTTLLEAGEWVHERWGKEADALIVLSALLFLYVANRGAEEKPGDPVWERIQARVQRLM